MRPDREFKVQTVPVTDPGDLLASLRDPGALAWVRRGDGLVGWGEAATIILPAGPDRFAVAERSLRGLFDAAETEDDVGLPGCGPVAFGSFTFDAARGGSVLVLPRTVLGRRAGTAWMTTITPIGPGQVSQGLSSAPTPARLRGRHGSLTGPQWERAVAAAVSR
jgi:menaquinone-specific isochorismate synthase